MNFRIHPDRVVLARDWKTLREGSPPGNPPGGQQGTVVVNETCTQATKIQLAIIYLVAGLAVLVEHHKKLYLPALPR